MSALPSSFRTGSPEEIMRATVALANENATDHGGGPFAAIIVRGTEIIASGVNQVTVLDDPTAHAEMVAIRNACKLTMDFRLHGMDLYTSCEPCPMCLGAIYWARLDRVFYAASRADAAGIGFDDAHIYRELCLPVRDRSVPMEQLLSADAKRVLEAWYSNPDRIVY